MLLTYVRYNLWANERFAAFLGRLDHALLDREAVNSFPSLRKTAWHIYDAETVWINRLQGRSLKDWPGKTLGEKASVARFLETSRQWVDLVADKEESFFSGDCTYTNLAGETYTNNVRGIVMHCMNHSTFHRGQFITILRQLGVTENLPSSDLIVFLRG